MINFNAINCSMKLVSIGTPQVQSSSYNFCLSVEYVVIRWVPVIDIEKILAL